MLNFALVFQLFPSPNNIKSFEVSSSDFKSKRFYLKYKLVECRYLTAIQAIFYLGLTVSLWQIFCFLPVLYRIKN